MNAYGSADTRHMPILPVVRPETYIQERNLVMDTQAHIQTRQPSKGAWWIAAALLLSPCLAQAQLTNVTVSENNATLRYNLREPFTLPADPSSPIVFPVQFPDSIEWTVDGRRILVYPSIPGNSMDVDHIHPGSHVAANQIHAQGPLFGYAASQVTVGIVYTVTGGASGSGESRISEKIDIRNKSSDPVPLRALTGLGWLPDRSAPHNADTEIPDLTGLNLTGTTMAFIQGDTGRPLITDATFGPVTVLPSAAFEGFNPFLVRDITLQPGATLTIISELGVARPGSDIPFGTAQKALDADRVRIPEPAAPEVLEGATPNPLNGAVRSPSDADRLKDHAAPKPEPQE